MIEQKRLVVAAVSLGCAKNRVDTEEMLGLLGGSGYTLAAEPEDAAVVLVNTCAFIDAAQRESIDTILALARRRRGRSRLIIAAGCLAERYGGELLKQMPELDGVIGVHSYRHLPDYLRRCRAGRREALVLPPPAHYTETGPRLLTAAPHSVYVKIAEGCDNHCRYCLFPALRGPRRARPASAVVAEIKTLLARGAREINLVAQDTTAYGGKDAGAPDLAGLLQKILALPGSFWLRLLYAYPSRVSDDLIELIATEPRLCSYLDLPLQHADSEMLRRMGRRYTAEQIVSLVERLRRRIPGLALRTTYLIGFPGETRARFNRLLSFISAHPFEKVGVFAYSPQAGTPAAALPGQVPRRIAARRRRELLSRQQAISLHLNRALTGSRAVVLLEKRLGGGLYFGRTRQQAPEVDGGVYFRAAPGLAPGSWVSVRLAAAGPYHLLGTDPILLHHLPT